MPYKNAEIHRKYQKEWVARRRAAWLAGKACVRCGSTERLEVDHKDSRTKVSHNVWSWREERRDAELAKCQVLCRACHVEKGAEVGDHRSYGEANGQSKLSADDVERIRTGEEPVADLAMALGVCKSTIYSIRRGATWSHLEYPVTASPLAS